MLCSRLSDKIKALDAGSKIILVYLLLAICIPCVLGLLFQEKIPTIYQVHSVNFGIAIEVSLGVLLYFLAPRMSVRMRNIKGNRVLNVIVNMGLLYKNNRKNIAVGCLLLSIVYLLSGCNGYRYTDGHILGGEHSFLLVFGILITNLIELDLLYHILIRLYIMRKLNSSMQEIAVNSILILALYCLASGTAHFLKTNLFLLLLIFSGFSGTFFNLEVNSSRSKLHTIAQMLVMLLVLSIAWVMGETVKGIMGNAELTTALITTLKDSGSGKEIKQQEETALITTLKESGSGKEIKQQEETALITTLKESGSDKEIKQQEELPSVFDFQSHQGAQETQNKYLARIKELASYMASRLSPHYYATLSVGQLTFKERIALMYKSVNTISNGFLYRFNRLTGGGSAYERPLIGSMCKLNYLALVKDPFVREKAGTSPGLFASFSHLLPFPLSSIVCALYLLCVANVAKNLTMGCKLNVMGVMIFYIFLDIFMESPFDALLLDPSTVYFIGLFLVSRVVRYQKISQNSASHSPPLEDQKLSFSKGFT